MSEINIERIECLKVDDQIFEIGDIIEITRPVRKGDYETSIGRFAGFKDMDDHCPPNLGIILDTSKQFLQSREIHDFRSVTGVKKINKGESNETSN